MVNWLSHRKFEWPRVNHEKRRFSNVPSDFRVNVVHVRKRFTANPNRRFQVVRHDHCSFKSPAGHTIHKTSLLIQTLYANANENRPPTNALRSLSLKPQKATSLQSNGRCRLMTHQPACLPAEQMTGWVVRPLWVRLSHCGLSRKGWAMGLGTIYK